jgi:hypothetical protein
MLVAHDVSVGHSPRLLRVPANRRRDCRVGRTCSVLTCGERASQRVLSLERATKGAFEPGGTMGKRGIAATTVALLSTFFALGAGPPSRAATSTQGVTASTIRIGIPYVDFAAVRAAGVNLNPGDSSDAYQALITNMNAHGGILGRRIVAYLVAVSPMSPAPAATSCTQLTQDDKIFVAIAPLMPDCYLADNVPTINGSGLEQKTYSPGWAPNFTLTPPFSAYDPLQLGVFSKMGAFKGKKVGVFGGDSTDKSEVAIVQASLAKLHVDVVSSAIDSAPEGDDPAAFAQVAIIAERFKSAGVNEVVAVGDGSATWPDGEAANQSSYNPSWVATNAEDLNGYLGGTNNPTYVKNMLTSLPIPQSAQVWTEPAIQSCVSIIKKAYPSDVIGAPPKVVTSKSLTNTPYEAPITACQNLALFKTIAIHAGKNLTEASFARAGEHLHGLVLPGVPSPVSFGPDRDYALGSVYIGRYDLATGTVEYSATSAAN